MGKIETTLNQDNWKESEKIIFRFFFIYFIIQAVPLDWKFYRDLFSINWLQLHYGDIFDLTRYAPQFFPGPDSFANWGVVFLIAVTGTALWTLKEQKERDYNRPYYWLRVILRYRLAIGVIGYGFLKLFPMQAPYPSLSNLNTNYGDLNAWKIFSMSLGIVPNYQSFLGFVEILGGLLLFYRKTATIGAFLIVVFTGNVFMSNLAYEGGEYVYSFYLIAIALFLLAFDALRLYTLFGLEKPTLPNSFNPSFSAKGKYIRLTLKSTVILFFVVLYGFKTISGFHNDPYQFPKKPGLAGASGIYNVTEFRLNNKIIPFSALDHIRWKDVVFEEWATISIRSNRSVILDSSNVEYILANDKARNYELSGSGGRHYYHYELDTNRNILVLENKNKNYSGEKLFLHYSRSGDNRIILKGVNEGSDSIYVALDRVDKKYLLQEAAKQGRNKGLEL
jgi:uncharacterized membrane protein YphA (DoxX/SURF4 family)